MTAQSEAPKVWPRAEGNSCSCPYCTAFRAGKLESIAADEQSPWLRRMGGMTR